jgi:hypothetical protein
MEKSRHTARKLCRWVLLSTLFFLVGGQAAFAYWYPAYDGDTYMGCTYMPGPLEGGNSGTVSPNAISKLGCYLLMVSGIAVADDPEPPPVPTEATFEDAGAFIQHFGLTSNEAVQSATAESAAEMRRVAQDLQAAALELMRAAQETESLTSAEELERWLGERLNPEPAPVCSPTLRQ